MYFYKHLVFYAVKKQRARVDTIDLKLRANLGEISLTLQNRARLVGALHIKGGEAAVIMKRSYTQVNAKLRDFEFLDLREYTRHNKVSSIFYHFQTTCCLLFYKQQFAQVVMILKPNYYEILKYQEYSKC